MLRKRIEQIAQGTHGIFLNVQWVFVELTGLAGLIKTPGAVNLEKVPAVVGIRFRQ